MVVSVDPGRHRCCGCPGRTVGEPVLGDRGFAQPSAAPRRRGRPVATPLDDDRVGEVLVKVVDVLDPTAFRAAAHGDEVEHGQVLDHLAEADAPGVWAHRHAELRREQEDGEVLVDPAHPAGVDLHHVDRLGLQELLEDDPVLDVLAGGDPDGAHGVADRAVAENVVGRGGLLDPVRLELGEAAHPVDGPVDAPALVGVEGDVRPLSGGDAGDLQAPDVGVDVAADLQLQHGEALGDRPANEARHLGVVVAQPAGRGGVGGQTFGFECGHALGAPIG